MWDVRDLNPRNYVVDCYRTGNKVEMKMCKACEHYQFDGAVAALGEYSFTYDTIMDVQSPHLCLWEEVKN